MGFARFSSVTLDGAVWENFSLGEIIIFCKLNNAYIFYQVARHFYHKEMRIELLREELLFDTVHVTFQLTFDNRAFTLASLAMTREEKHLPISASVLFEIFPFCIVFG